MIHALKRAWSDMVLPIWVRPRQVQVAALCYKMTKKGKKVLLITSRGTGRWIVPKGWPIEGKNEPQSALQEAWEEAGVSKADIADEPLGTFDYDKGLDDGSAIPIETRVYKTHVHGLEDDFPEVDQRTRKWFAPDEAAELVDEPELKAILRELD